MYDFEGDRAPDTTDSSGRAAPASDAPSGGGHGAPPIALTALEFPRFLGEYAASRALDLASLPLAAAPRLNLPIAGPRDVGRGRPVLVLPGFAANDHLTGRLRSHLRGRGFAVHGWGLGRNIGLTDQLVDGLTARFLGVAERFDEPVSIVGWSFGGVLARRLAHEHPDRVARIVCLGSPWRADGERTRATAMFERSRVKHGISDRALEIVTRLREPVPVPTTAIYSRTDGVVPWRGCRVDERPASPGPLAENVEVISSHVGLVSNPLVLRQIVARLAADTSSDGPGGTDEPPVGATPLRAAR
ncbi:triacylglycerol lipase [Nocardioides sp. R-C-SC26]|uniref:esterase/lipase family protein n=1 Tax=Nocardioides sp. R-C-SC26 TaxID=2870414 RepID=UPI001E63FDE3|nr:alpha/beta fold hydrolase [Nocardioides sp. R-C-SC26]